MEIPCLAQNDLFPVVKPDFMQHATGSKLNYTTFSVKRKPVSTDWKTKNARFISHPDMGYIPGEQPPGNVVEIMEKRTETTRFYIDSDTKGKVFSQGSYGPLHYKRNGQWLMVDSRLDDKQNGLLEASHQPEPVGFDLKAGKSYFKTAAGQVFFNDWKLFGANSNKKKLLAQANWDDYTCGDDGVLVKNIFPGIDAEMHVTKGRIKTNLIIRKWAFKGFESYIFADHFQTAVKGNFSFVHSHADSSGVGEVDYKVQHKLMARVGHALVYAEKEPGQIVYLPYSFEATKLGMTVDAEVLAALLKKGNVVIDPMVTGPEGVYAPGNVLNSYNNANCSENADNACSYTWKVPVPPFITVTNTYLTTNYETLAPCTRDKMRMIYGFGDQKCGQDIIWHTVDLPETPGTTAGYMDAAPYYNNCIRASCELTYVDFNLSVVRMCMGPPGCESSCVQGVGPFVTTIEGRTLEMLSVAATPNYTECPGETVELLATADFGIKPHSFQWMPGNLDSSATEVKPLKSTTYTVTVTDACNQKVSDEVTVTVPPLLPAMTAAISSPVTSVCEGTELHFSAQVTNVISPAYQWKVNGANVPGANSEQFRSAGLQDNDLVTLEVTNPEVCAIPKILVTDSIRVHIYPNKPDEQPIHLAGCDSVAFDGRIFTSDTTFQQVLRSVFGCDSVNRVVQISIKPFKLALTANFSGPLFHGDPVELLVTAESAGFTVTGWTPSGLFPDQRALSQIFQVTETDTLFSVHAISDQGCADSAYVALKSQKRQYGNLLPNVFTPDGDGINDLWEPLKKSVFPTGELFVYNRWGQCVFYSSDYTIPWNGTHKGAKVPSGVYAYRLILDKKNEIKGMVAILY